MAERKRKNKPEVSSRATIKYVKNHYDRIGLQIPAGTLDKLKECAKASGARSLQQWIASILEKETGLNLALRGENFKKSGSDESDEEGSAE